MAEMIRAEREGEAELSRERFLALSTPFPEPKIQNHQKPRAGMRVWRPSRG
jgi:hypothetical protein